MFPTLKCASRYFHTEYQTTFELDVIIFNNNYTNTEQERFSNAVERKTIVPAQRRSDQNKHGCRILITSQNRKCRTEFCLLPVSIRRTTFSNITSELSKHQLIQGELSSGVTANKTFLKSTLQWLT